MEWLYGQFPEFIDKYGLRHKNIHEIFLNNLWIYRNRVIPLKLYTLDGLRKIKSLELPVDLVYIDASHTYAAVVSEIKLIRELFPNAVICGDDYSSIGWPGVVQAVDECAEKYGYQLETHGLFWIYQKKFG